MSKSVGVRQGEVERLRGQVERLERKLERSLDDNSRLCRKVEQLELQLMDERRSAVAAQRRAAREEQRRAQLQTRGWR